MNNYIYLRHKLKIIASKGTGQLSQEQIATLLLNLETLGFTLSRELVEVISSFNADELSKFYKNIVQDLKEFVGVHVNYDPMYPNFPEQVMSASETELYMNAYMHYLGDAIGYKIMPFYEKLKRAFFNENIKLKIIDLGNKEEFDSIFTNILSSKTSIPQAYKKDIEWFVKNRRNNILELIPANIPLKENVAVLASVLIPNTEIYNEVIPKYIKRANDVLRLAVGMSGGDVSLAENTKFVSFPKRVRRFLLSLIERQENITDDMLKYREEWIRLGERLHPSEYKAKYPKTNEAFNIIRNNLPYKSFNSQIENLLVKKDMQGVIELMKNEPGQFARRLDHLIRIADDKEFVVKYFEEYCEKVSTPVLLQVLTFYKNRNKEKEYRIFFPKGDVAKVYGLKNNLPVLDELVCEEIIAICENSLIKKFGKLKPLGKVYIEENLKNFNVPFAMRSASKALKTYVRGSKIDLPEAKAIRFFLWWKDSNDRTDIDLSAVGLQDDFRFKTAITYYNLKDFGGYHSGDITSAPNGACEFIDIDIEKFQSQGIRYVVLSLNSFTQQPFCDLPECFAGYMTRQEPNSGEIFEPRSVQQKIDIASDTKISLVAVIDLKENKMIWADLALRKQPGFSNNVHANLAPITLMAKAIVWVEKPDLYALFTLHAKARGQIVNNIEEADTIFAVDQGITPFDTLRIMSEYL